MRNREINKVSLQGNFSFHKSGKGTGTNPVAENYRCIDTTNLNFLRAYTIAKHTPEGTIANNDVAIADLKNWTVPRMRPKTGNDG